MNRNVIVSLACLLFLATAPLIPAYGQYRDTGFEVGILGGTAYDNSKAAEDRQPGISGRLSLAAPIFSFMQWEIGGGYTELRDHQVYSVLTPADLILKLAPFGDMGAVPYVYGGGGILYYRYDKFPSGAVFKDRNGWVPYIPVGAGVVFKVSDRAQFEVRGSYNQTFSADVSPAATRKDDDSFYNVLAGIRINVGGGNPDKDSDGLSNAEEEKLGTDPNNPDSDADSLKDGEEHNTYHTNPLNRDTDADGLGDGAEVMVHNTDALKIDTDGDGLSDGAEVTEYNTNPLKSDTDDDGLDDNREVTVTYTDPRKADSDGDGLSDSDEVNKYKTDPLKMDTDGGTIADGLEVERKTDPLKASDDLPQVKTDTDGDGLTDEDETNKYHTNPHKMDTDGGTIADGLEVERGTNPLDPKDDMPPAPPPKVLVFEKDKPVVLVGIQFEFNKAVIKPESEAILIQTYNTLNDHKEINIEISGHTDAIGSDAYNQKLSERRAESVRLWLINKGIDSNRITAVGFGESRPIATNDTEEGRAQNRRIEVKRTN